MSDMNISFFEDLATKPAFCFTSDIDWAPESMIKEILNIFSQHGIPLTPFITHHSETIKEHYKGSKTRYVGLHPNFLSGSTQGSDLEEIITNLVDLWPDAKCFRSHLFFDNKLIAEEFYARGFRYDSNLCLHLQPNLVPLQHFSGLLRFPVFLEDDTYALREKIWDLSHVKDFLKTPGLKVFNFHPIHVALNTPDMDYYESVKKDVDENWKRLVFKGAGVYTFLVELLEYVSNNPGLGVFYLHDLYSFITDTAPKDVIESQARVLEKYDKSTIEKRVQAVRTDYDTRDGKELYVTSRDFNLREIEIDFTINCIREKTNANSQKIIPRILDIGCGNGYTDIRIAKVLKAEIVGIDFSKEMIKGAEHLREKSKGEIISSPIFQVGDVRKLDRADNYFDVVVSERCLLNLPDRDTQYNVIREFHRVLKKGGTYIMVEGTLNGLRRLNELRLKVGLEPIPDRAEYNVSSLKFEEKEIEEFLSTYFKILLKHHFGMYYLISRVVHPLLVLPDQPRFNARINKIAREIAMHEPDYKKIGHVMGFVLEAI
ncbi:MAG: methyltransferase domain-containing protein [Deltaproteobacteria bacterium]|nr:methyltransferase domain-containing protein [Deltaproteobacteria bacterium]